MREFFHHEIMEVGNTIIEINVGEIPPMGVEIGQGAKPPSYY